MSFSVVLPGPDGTENTFPMRAWLRSNPHHLPLGIDPATKTSHQLRDLLRRKQWRMETRANEVRLIAPDGIDVSAAPGTVSPDLVSDDLLSEAESDAEIAFALEYQLRDFIAQNLATIPVGQKRLRLYVDGSGRNGVEYPTDVGPIDILAVDDAGNFVAFELKRATSSDRAIGQLARYMGWLRQHLANGRGVEGVIVSKDVSDNLRYAVTVIPNVSLFEYEVQFTLKAIPAPTR